MSWTKVYLSGVKRGDNSIQLPLSSVAVIYILEYCNYKHLKLTFVNDDNCKLNCVSIETCHLQHLDVVFTGKEGNNQFCSLPVMIEDDGHLVRSGLCSVIRQIINLADKENAQESYKDLLGFRGGSLKACAEQSGWTKLCEVELPESIMELVNTIRHVDTLSQVELPENLMKLEWHFYKRARVHNDDKQKRKLLSQVRNEAKKIRDTSELSGFKFQRDIDLPHGVVRYEIKQPKNNQSTLTENAQSTASKRNGELITCQANGKCCDCEKIESDEKFHSVNELTKFLADMTIWDIDYLHVYSEGERITVSDLILFCYLYFFLESLSFRRGNLKQHIPKIMGWIDHMVTLPRIQQSARNCGYNLDSLTKGDNQHLSDNQQTEFFISELVQSLVNNDDMELSHRCRAKYRAIKPDVTYALNKIQEGKIEVETGPHPCGEDIHLDWDSMPEGIHPGTDLPMERLNRKCQQLENLVTAVVSIARPGDVIVDFCSGGGHLGIAIAYMLPECEVYLVENNEMSLMRARDRVIKSKLENVTLFQCNQDYFHGIFDIGVCLHACGTATDMVLHQSLKNNASFVVCPCCYGGIQNTHLMSYPRSQLFQSANIPYKAFLTLGHAADQTEFNINREEQGQYCMNLVDTDRASLARENGYTVTLCSLSPLSCTPKNNLLIGQPCNR